DLPEREGSRGDADDRQSEEKPRLGERRERSFPAGAHAFEARSGIERGGHRKEASEAEEVGERDDIAAEGQRRRSGAERDQQPGREQSRKGDNRAGTKDPSRGAAVDGALLKEFPSIEVR